MEGDIIDEGNSLRLSLAKGSMVGNKSDVYAKVAKLCNYTNFPFKVGASDKRRASFVCTSSACPFAIRARVQTCGTFKVTHSQLDHTCDGSVPRKQQLPARVLNKTSPAVRIAAPMGVGKGKTLQTQQLMDSALQADGLHLKQGQARNILQSKADPLAPWYQYESFQYLPSLEDNMKRVDPAGSFELKVRVDDKGRTRFVFFYVAGSSEKQFWMHTRKIRGIDATFVTAITGGVILLSTVKDANDQIMTLNWMHCATECKETWMIFLIRCKRDFPDCVVHLSDRDKR
jgi:hypothetical protein